MNDPLTYGKNSALAVKTDCRDWVPNAGGRAASGKAYRVDGCSVSTRLATPPGCDIVNR
jgi:hypothetical protein